jgi:hypothetical protein
MSTIYHTVSVKVKYEDDKGKIKTRTERYLVDAMSVTEAEARTVKFLGTQFNDYEIVSASQSRILHVIPSQEKK